MKALETLKKQLGNLKTQHKAMSLRKINISNYDYLYVQIHTLEDCIRTIENVQQKPREQVTIRSTKTSWLLIRKKQTFHFKGASLADELFMLYIRLGYEVKWQPNYWIEQEKKFQALTASKKLSKK